MERKKEWIYKWGFVFDTHNATYYLDENNNIVWIESKKIKREQNIIWAKTQNILDWFIWNNLLYAINSSNEECSNLIRDLNTVYASRVKRWLKSKWDNIEEVAA